MENSCNLLRFLILLVIMHCPYAKRLNIVSDCGAKADGVTDNSAAFMKAWGQACTSAGEATLIYVPPGQYLVHPTVFSGPCVNTNITVEVDGTLVARTDSEKYGASKYWLMFKGVKGLTFKGGYLDGKGSSLWSCKAGKGNCPNGARTMVFNKVSNLLLTKITSIDSELFHIVIDGCQNVLVDSLKISAAGTSPNTDGIHVEQSTGVTIMNSDIGTGDDCISVGEGTQNLWIEGISCGPGHGISIGSLGQQAIEAGVQNVTVRNVVLTGTTNGLRIKSWARSSSGFATDIIFDGANMNNVKYPIIIDQNYCPNNANCPNQNSGVKISQVTYNNVRGTSATPVAVLFQCSASNGCQGIKMTNVQLTYNGKPSTASCQNAFGTYSGIMLPPSCLKASTV